jgi:hypothetical protein
MAGPFNDWLVLDLGNEKGPFTFDDLWKLYHLCHTLHGATFTETYVAVY